MANETQTPSVKLIGDGDGLDCPCCGKAPAKMYAVAGLDGYIDACRPCAPRAAADALSDMASA